MNLIFRRWRLGGTSARGIKSQMTNPVAIIRNDGIRPDGTLFSYVTKERFREPVVYAFRWGCTSAITAEHVVNTAEAIEWCNDKRKGRLEMQEAGVSVPKTWGGYADFSRDVVDDYTGNYIARPVRHAQGKKLVHSGDKTTLLNALTSWGGGYISEFVPKTAEYRVAVIQNRVAWVARKTPGNPQAIAWNVARGGRFDNVAWDEWPMEVVKEALKAAKVSGCDFCGVDVMTTEDGKPYVLEINSAPSQTSPYRQSCFSKCFDYIIEHGKAHLPDPEVIKTYKAVIHPAIRTKGEARA